jgi:hypothetical protein
MVKPLHRRFPAEYNIWTLIRQRCLNPTRWDWKHYGGRGIKLCQRWKESFANFLADVGPRPMKGLWLGRLDVNGHYEPTNCQWQEPKYPVGNRRYCHKAELNGEVLNIVEVARRQSIYPNTFRHRMLKQEMPADQAYSLPMTRHGGPRMLTFQGRTQSIAAWAREAGIKPVTLQARLFRYGLSMEDAMTRGRMQKDRSPVPSAS